MPVERLRPPGLYPAAPYAYVAVAPPGRLVVTAGACPLDEAGRIVAPGDVAAQAERAVANLLVALAATGAGPADVLKTTTYVAGDRSDLLRAWTVVRAAFGELDPPSTLLGVSALGYPGQLVEVEAVAALP